MGMSTREDRVSTCYSLLSSQVKLLTSGFFLIGCLLLCLLLIIIITNYHGPLKTSVGKLACVYVCTLQGCSVGRHADCLKQAYVGKESSVLFCSYISTPSGEETPWQTFNREAKSDLCLCFCWGQMLCERQVLRLRYCQM